MIYVLLIASVSLFAISFVSFKRDIMSPAVLVCLVFSMTVILSFRCYNYWDLGNYSPKTTQLYIFGFTAFFIGCLISSKIRLKLNLQSNRSESFDFNFTRQRIEVSAVSALISLLISVTTLVWFLMEFRNVVNVSNALNIIISQYKFARVNGELESSSILNLLLKCNSSFAYISAFICVLNTSTKKWKRSDALLLFNALIYVVISLLQSNRGDILVFVMALVCFWYITYNRLRSWKRKIFGKTLRKLATIGVISIVLFWLSLTILGTQFQQGENKDFLLYICGYASGPISSFDLYMILVQNTR